MVPEEFRDDYAAWIEMDKFYVELEAGRHTLPRASDESSVVRQPVIKADCLEEGTGCPDERGSAPGCRCGWPYTLLLPRGREDGMPCRFMVMASPGDDLTMADRHRKAGTSYCGLQDSDYPDSRPMGYPFDRPFADSISDTLDGEPHMAAAQVMLHHTLVS